MFAVTDRQRELDAAWRYSAALTAAMPRHMCWCGDFGSFRFAKGGAWFCHPHTRKDANGFLHPVEREAAQ